MEEAVQQSAVEVNIEDEMRQSYMDYAMSVIVGRALPDVRDGLKPVQRRILYAMLGEGLLPGHKHSKCAGVVGEVLKRLHPHGDMAVYDALVRMAQPWNLRNTLVDGQGNFGSIDGDPPAAYRYTECRLTAFAEQLLRDLDKETVDYAPNFDETSVEPLVLPSILPNLLVNGADGIAVGMATHMPPHNLREVINAIVAQIKNPSITLDELMHHLPGPDFPTGGLIHGKSGIRSAYLHGKGVLQLRARVEIEKIGGRSRAVEAVVITEIPYQVNKARLVERIAELVNDKTIEGISRIRDESDRKGMRIVIELKRDATSSVVLNQLFKHTPMQTSFGVINLAIVEGQPMVLNLQGLLGNFIGHRRDVVTRRTQFELKKAEERMHLLEGYRIALLNLDEVIALIKAAETPKDARAALMTRFGLSELQAQAILDLRLQKLTGMERLAVEKEHQELGEEIKRLLALLSDAAKIDSVIINELEELRDKFSADRRTEIIAEVDEIDLEDMIEDEEMVVSVSHEGYIKRTSTSVYRAQKRGGKGVAGASTKEEDFIQHLFVASTLSYLLVFTDIGRLYCLKVYQIPEGNRTARGRALVNLLQLRADEKIAAILSVKKFAEKKFVLMGTALGAVKKVELMEFANVRRNGLTAYSLRENDRLIGAQISSGNDDIVLATKDGIAIRFREDQIRSTSRTAGGVRGISLDKGDEVVGMAVFPDGGNGAAQQEGGQRAADLILTVCENGYGKRSRLSDYRSQHRGGKGIFDIKTVERNGPVIGICIVDDKSELMLITSSGTIIRLLASGISVIGRNTKGVRLINLEEGEKVVDIAHIRDEEEEASA